MLTRSPFTRLALFCALAGALLAFSALPSRADTASDIASLKAAVAALQTQNASLQAQINALKSVTRGFSRVTDTTRQDGKQGTELYITGMNLHVVNGLGATDGRPDGTGMTQVNGLGNLIVGYNDARGDGNNIRTGSHNIVVGVGANYTSYGGLVTGVGNTISGSYATVTGGVGNTASGAASNIGGGLYLQEFSTYGFAAGGQYTQASPGPGTFHSP